MTGQTRGGTDDRSSEDLLRDAYAQLRLLAGRYFRHQSRDHTLQPTALVHEAFLKLNASASDGRWESREHFLAVAATAMRQILINHAHKRRALKRGAGVGRLTLGAGDGALAAMDLTSDLIALDEARDRLSERDERKARVVEARFFGGMTVEEVATALGISVSTVESDWRLARAWLSTELGGDTRS